MIPKVSRCGRSFKGLFAYCMSDRNSASNDRVAWTRALNVPDLGKETWRVMVHTVQSAETLKRGNGASTKGRKLERPVFTYSLSWAPDQELDQAHMEETALNSVKALGLEEHEAWLVCHNDTNHPHVHVIVNRVHPLTGYAASIDCSARKLQRFASDYERATKIYCHEREKNRRQDENTGPPNLEAIQQLWNSGIQGEQLLVALERTGIRVYRGRKRPVFVSNDNQIFNPVRSLENITAKDLRNRLVGLELNDLPDGGWPPYSSQKSFPRLTSDVPPSPPV
ncbi:relaxase/mobilization nuclease domain-containing protein [Akkermansiaceae bacterium]|nr:relaxase/mobilization nuclease domain-containing protein [Akkermansiaceae bacterium]MDA7907297.1 relaxase/mobilization nuclease domain-containing protein [Akkermansiaceae bacterium]MDB4465201.1 relaxase/mobilization nuclease domain-containing protein [Akkermansiaceae bacterium]MDB4509701.1 relaxase/mobilization nuclease domain-containing protein [Akkermansiaceae bacterium]